MDRPWTAPFSTPLRGQRPRSSRSNHGPPTVLRVGKERLIGRGSGSNPNVVREGFPFQGPRPTDGSDTCFVGRHESAMATWTEPRNLSRALQECTWAREVGEGSGKSSLESRRAEARRGGTCSTLVLLQRRELFGNEHVKKLPPHVHA